MSEQGGDISDRSKDQQISNIRAHDKAALKSWLQASQQETPGIPRLDLPEKALRGFIPQRLYELVADPSKIDIKSEEVDVGEAGFFVIEHMESPITDLHSFTLASTSDQDDCPPSVDPMHWKYKGAFHSNLIGPKDKILLYIDLNRIGSESDADLHVEYFEVHDDLRRNGIAKDFYQGLKEFARGQYHYITGQNSQQNIETFTQLGRIPYGDLTPTEQVRMRNLYEDSLGDLTFLTVYDLTK